MNVIIKTLTISKGKSVENGDGSWIKTSYTLEATLEYVNEHDATKEKLEGIIDGWLIPVKGISPLKSEKASTPRSGTAWRSTRNTGIEWCPEKEADPEDVKKALDPNDKSVWCLEGKNSLSIFRRVHKDGNG